MSKVLAFQELDTMKQNLSSVENGEGIFILNANGDIIFENREARKTLSYFIKEEIKRKIEKKKIVFNRGNKKIMIYPIMEGNEIKLFFGIIRNNKDIEKMEEKIKHMQRSFEIFKENMSHYFFNPLVIAKGYLELILEKEEDAEKRESITKVKEAVERIEKVVKNIVTDGTIKE